MTKPSDRKQSDRGSAERRSDAAKDLFEAAGNTSSTSKLIGQRDAKLVQATIQVELATIKQQEEMVMSAVLIDDATMSLVIGV